MRSHVVFAAAWLGTMMAAAGVVPTGHQDIDAPRSLPAMATTALGKSLRGARSHSHHVWRDTPPLSGAGTLNAYVEIPVGERTKWEYDMRANRLEVDRVVPTQAGAYPVNYGFVPQTVSYDGDPFDVLVLGPALPRGTLVRTTIVGLMSMEDEKGHDAKVVASPLDERGAPRYALTGELRTTIGEYFDRYKTFEPGKHSRVLGWGSAAEGLAYVETTHAFFLDCRTPGQTCTLPSASSSPRDSAPPPRGPASSAPPR